MPARTSLSDLGDAAERLAREVKELASTSTSLLIDAGSGLGPGAGCLAAATDDVVVVSTPEPTSLADAHAAISRFHELRIARVRVLVNQAGRTPKEWKCSMESSTSAANSKGAVVAPLGPGFVRVDPHVPMAVRGRRPFVTAFPASAASRGVRRIARALCLERYPPDRKNGTGDSGRPRGPVAALTGRGRLTNEADDSTVDAGQPFSGRSCPGRE